MVTFTLLIIGGLNWGLALFGHDVGTFLPMIVSQIIYALVALSAIIEIFTHKRTCKMCGVKDMPMGNM